MIATNSHLAYHPHPQLLLLTHSSLVLALIFFLNKMMLGRTVRPAIHTVAKASNSQAQQVAQRNMATLREIEQRLKSVRNIEKITKVSFEEREKE